MCDGIRSKKVFAASLVVAFALAASPAIAKTVLWYHFNDGNVGDRASTYRDTQPFDKIANAAEGSGDLTGLPGGYDTSKPPGVGRFIYVMTSVSIPMPHQTPLV